MIIIFEYYSTKSGTYEKDQFETETFEDFKCWLADNKIINYEILNIIMEG